MRAVRYEAFGEMADVATVPEPGCPPDGVVVEVEASGLCRSDWHGWMGHDPGIRLPHVPGHEFSGLIAERGSEVRRWAVGDRVTAPFVLACGACATCRRGDGQVCEQQEQPGFTYWGSFAERVVVMRADLNLVRVPDSLDLAAAATLGCRFATAYRALVQVAGLRPAERIAVHGCGGVGLSAVMIATALGAEVIAVDVAPESLRLATALGAAHVVDANDPEVASRVRDLTGGGADVSIDALGSPLTMRRSMECLRPRGRHVQIGLLAGRAAAPVVPMHLVISRELQLLGSHGISASSYGDLLRLVDSEALRPQGLVRDHISLEETPARLAAFGGPGGGAGGITIIVPGDG